MEYTNLGNSGIKVSKLSFGSLTMSACQANLPAEDAARVMAYAFERGINFVDTAQLYDNYEYISLALKKTNKDVVVASKTYAYEKDAAYNAVEQARVALGRDMIDIFLLHEQESEHTLRGHRPALDELLRLKSIGVLRAVGISTHHIAGVLAAAALPEIDMIHPLINYTGIGIVDGAKEKMEDALRIAFDAGKGIYTMKPLGGGNLFKNAEKCLQYAFDFKYKHSVCIGMQSCDEIDANIEFCEKLHFSEEANRILSSKQRRLNIDSWCIGCGKCAEFCKNGGIGVRDGKAAPNEKCVLCGYCASVCPMWAIKII